MADLLEIGSAVRARRKELKLTLPALSERSGVSRARIAALETQRIPEIGFKNLVSVLNAIGLDLRLTTLNRNRPTLEDLLSEKTQDDDPGVVRQKTRGKAR